MKTPSRRIAATVFLWIMAVSAMCMIFVFSAQNSNESTKTSGTVARAVLSLVVPEYKEMTPAQQDALVEKVMLPVRKLAHFSIYAWLGFWLLLLWGQYRKKHLLPLSAAVSAVYAVTDELHQRLVSGRSGRPTDVLIDTAGALVGAAFALLLRFLWQKLRNNRIKPL